MLRLALCSRIHRGHSRQLTLARLKFQRRVFHLRRNAGEFPLPLLVRINTHVELVKSAKSVGDVDVDQCGKDRLPVRTGDRELR